MNYLERAILIHSQGIERATYALYYNHQNSTPAAKMPSKESQRQVDLFELLNKFLKQEGVGLDLYRLLLEELGSVGAEPTNVTYEEIQCPGTVRPAIWCKPVDASSSHVIMYFHGGGYVAGSPSSLRRTAAHLAKAACCYSLVIDYRKAPEHPFPAQLDDAHAAYQWLLNDRGISSKHIAFAGDSAGGNLSITLSLKLRELGQPLPAAIAGFSAWTDMEQRGKTYDTNVKADVLVSREASKAMADLYLGETSAKDPLIDLLNADLKGLPPMYLAVGSAEVMVDDSVMLVERAEAAGVESHLELSEGMQHLYIFMAGHAPEADKTINDVGSWIKEKIGTSIKD